MPATKALVNLRPPVPAEHPDGNLMPDTTPRAVFGPIVAKQMLTAHRAFTGAAFFPMFRISLNLAGMGFRQAAPPHAAPILPEVEGKK